MDKTQKSKVHTRLSRTAAALKVAKLKDSAPRTPFPLLLFKDQSTCSAACYTLHTEPEECE